MKKILKQLVILGMLIGCVLFLLPEMSFAYSIPKQYMPENTPFDLNFDKGDVKKAPEAPLILILQIISGTLLYIAAPIAVISIVMAAFTLVSSAGAAEKLETGKKHLTWAILGLLLIIFSYAIVKAIITISFESFNQKESEAKASHEIHYVVQKPTTHQSHASIEVI